MDLRVHQQKIVARDLPDSLARLDVEDVYCTKLVGSASQVFPILTKGCPRESTGVPDPGSVQSPFIEFNVPGGILCFVLILMIALNSSFM